MRSVSTKCVVVTQVNLCLSSPAIRCRNWYSLPPCRWPLITISSSERWDVALNDSSVILRTSPLCSVIAVICVPCPALPDFLLLIDLRGVELLGHSELFSETPWLPPDFLHDDHVVFVCRPSPRWASSLCSIRTGLAIALCTARCRDLAVRRRVDFWSTLDLYEAVLSAAEAFDRVNGLGSCPGLWHIGRLHGCWGSPLVPFFRGAEGCAVQRSSWSQHRRVVFLKIFASSWVPVSEKERYPILGVANMDEAD